MSGLLSASRRRRLWGRVESCVETRPDWVLDAVAQLLPDGGDVRELKKAEARALTRLNRQAEAARCWATLLEDDQSDDAVEALPCLLSSFDYASIKKALGILRDAIPRDEEALILCIRAAQVVREFDLALSLCERLVDIAPLNPVHQAKLGSLYQSHGRMQDAQQAFEQALKLDANFQPAWYFLAHLRKWEAGMDHLGELTDFLEQYEGAGTDTSATHYALAKELEDLGLYHEAFSHLESGARQMRSRSRYHVDQDKKLMTELQAWYRRSAPSTAPGMQGEGPLFILGMPRTGSTLTDRVLSSHSDVESVGELNCFKRAVEECCGGQGHADFFASFYAHAPSTLPYNKIGARYLEMLSPLTTDKRFFIDKMPMNYAFVGLIARALPGARFIHTVRNPMDTCFSNYKQMFGEGYYGYSYDLQELAGHYKLYCQLMDFWRQQLPGRIYDLHYEQMVVDTETEVRKLLHWLGLEWQPQCLEFHQNKAAVNTASQSQVRRPIYRDSLEKWRKFENCLGPLLNALA